MKSTIKADKIIKLKNKNIKKNDYEIDYNKELNPKNVCDSIYSEALPVIMEQTKNSVCRVNKKVKEQELVFYVKYHSQIHLLYCQY